MSSVRTLMAIDPGLNGAIARFNADGHLSISDMPTTQVTVSKKKRRRINPHALAIMITKDRPDHVFVEQVATRPSEGAVGAFSFGRGYGMIEGILAASSIPYTLVRPQEWKKATHTPKDKSGARQRACQVWPDAAASFSRVKDDGRAEASLILHYGITLLKGGLS